jgi:hypothetical protein
MASPREAVDGREPLKLFSETGRRGNAARAQDGFERLVSVSISNGLRLAQPLARAPSSPLFANWTAARILLVLLVVLLAVSATSVLLARAAVPIPMTTQGAAFDRTGSPLPIGTPVRTFLDGVDYSNASVVEDAAGSYSVLTQGNLVLNATTPEPSPTKHGANAGELVQYAASDITGSADVFQETHAWSSDSVVTQDLHLGSVLSTPQPLKIQGIVAQPAQASAPYVFLCNPSAVAVSLDDYYLQRDAPGTYFGGNLSLAGGLAPETAIRENLTFAFGLVATGDALKLVYRNPGGSGAAAGGLDLVVDRVEFNATLGGTLDWQPGSTIMGSAPAPGPGQVLERSTSCADTNSPSDFHLAAEPGLPAALPPVVTISAPGRNQNLQGGQVFTFRWTMTDNVFASSYLLVWVNLTVNGVTTPLLSAATGTTSVDWSVPDLEAPGSTLLVQVVDPFGGRGSATATFNVAPATPFSAYVAIIVVVVVAGFIVWALWRARRESEKAQAPPPSPPPLGALPPAAPRAAGVAQGPLPPGTKVCPRCRTLVKEADETCFYCGYGFVPPT